MRCLDANDQGIASERRKVAVVEGVYPQAEIYPYIEGADGSTIEGLAWA